MLKNHFIIAIRTLLANRLYTVINIFGLTVGISSCLVIFLIVNFELSFNRTVPQRENIYRVYSTFSGDFDGVNRGVSTGVQEAVASKFSGLEAVVPLYSWSAKVTLPGVAPTDAMENESRLVLVPPDYFSVVPVYDWIRGSAESLTEPSRVVLDITQAKKYFGTDAPDELMGKTLHYNDSLVLTVSGLVARRELTTDFEFTDFISQATIEPSWLKQRIGLHDWESTNSSTQLFIKLQPQTAVADIEKQLLDLDAEYKKHNANDGWRVSYKFQALSDLHFNTELGVFDNSRPAAHLATLTTLAVVAIILLVMASINFINLETARAVKRAREVGIRKVMGSTRAQLVRHFLIQSMLLALVAVLVAIPAAEMGLLLFDEFVPAGVTLSLSDKTTIIFLTGVVFVVGVLSGLYPAFVLSSFLPAVALKSQGYISSASSRSAYLRKGLIVFQFASAQLLIIGTMVIVSQINFMLDKDLGFTKDAVIHVQPPWRAPQEKRFVLKNELERVSGVGKLSLCQSPPATKGYSSNVLVLKRNGNEVRKSVMRKFGDPNYTSVYGIQLVAGRNIAPNHRTEILVNEAFVRDFGLTMEDALGQEVTQHTRSFTIVGVTKDFHVFSLHEPFSPVYICGWEEDLYGISLKLALPEKDPHDMKPIVEAMEVAWKKVYPDNKFNYQFVDETIRNFYINEQRTSRLAGTAMAIAILISCLGLFGLVSFTSIQRSKEVGIRKVLGATARNILFLLSSDFLRLVMIAFVIAVPVAWWGAGKYLEDFSFHVTPGVSLYLLAGSCSLLLALFTVSYQAIKTSFMNPVESLRIE